MKRFEQKDITHAGAILASLDGAPFTYLRSQIPGISVESVDHEDDALRIGDYTITRCEGVPKPTILGPRQVERYQVTVSFETGGELARGRPEHPATLSVRFRCARAMPELHAVREHARCLSRTGPASRQRV